MKKSFPIKANEDIEAVGTRTSNLWMLDESIIYIEKKPDVEIRLEDAIENNQVILAISKSNKWSLLIDIRSIKSISKEAREYYSDDKSMPGRCAIALLVDSYFSRIMANIFIGYSNASIPIKLFSSKEMAMEWLKKKVYNE